MIFEHHLKPLLTTRQFLHRQLIAVAISFALLLVWILLGMLGYHILADLPWVDAFLNTAMIVGGMGPVDLLRSNSAKIFAGVYAILSGVILLSSFGVLAAPLYHRFLHKFHLDIEDDDGVKKTKARK